MKTIIILAIMFVGMITQAQITQSFYRVSVNAGLSVPVTITEFKPFQYVSAVKAPVHNVTYPVYIIDVSHYCDHYIPRPHKGVSEPIKMDSVFYRMNNTKTPKQYVDDILQKGYENKGIPGIGIKHLHVKQ